MNPLIPAISADDILQALARQAADDIYASELAFNGGSRRCDFWRLSVWPSKAYVAQAYEIKISRADFRRDSKIKQREARLFSDKFYYVTPVGLISVDEIPDWAGLIEFDGEQLRQKLPAPTRDKDSPSWEFVVSLIRQSGTVSRDLSMIEQRCRRAEAQVKDAEKKLRAAGLEPWRFGIT